MAEEPENLVPTYLGRLDAKIDRLSDAMRDVKLRLTTLKEAFVGMQRRFDWLELRVVRNERRLDLVDHR